MTRATWVPAAFLLSLCLYGTRPANAGSPRASTMSSSTQQTNRLSAQPTLHVTAVRFAGNTVFSDAQLADSVRKVVGHDVSVQEIEQARLAVTQRYIDAGYINSGALLPDQDVGDGVITLQIVEGKLTQVDIKGVDSHGKPRKLWLRRSYLVARVTGTEPVLNVVKLQERLELIRQNTNVERVNAELKPGDVPGESRLEMLVEERNPLYLAIEFSNKRSPSVGPLRLETIASHSNLTGNSDALSFHYLALRGRPDDLEFAGLDDFGINYALPLNASDTALLLGLSRSDSVVIEQDFQSIDIDSETLSADVTLRQPLYRSLGAEFAVSVTASARDNKTSLLGEPFSFSAGDVDGHSRVMALRLGQEFSRRTQNDSLFLRSTVSIGMDVLGATIHSSDDTPDSQFLAWLGQLQYIRRLWDTDSQVIFRTNLQLANSPLLSVEQFSVGGFYTVRGYRENALVRDNGVVGSLEFRIPILRKAGESILDLAPFADIGYGWNVSDSPNFPVLSSVGIGLLFHPNRHVDLQVYWGHPFKDFNSRDDLQDIGIHFDLVVSPF